MKWIDIKKEPPALERSAIFLDEEGYVFKGVPFKRGTELKVILHRGDRPASALYWIPFPTPSNEPEDQSPERNEEE